MIIKGLSKGTKDEKGKMLWMIVVATIPAAIMGVLFEEKIEEVVRNKYWLIAICLAIMGIIISAIIVLILIFDLIMWITMPQMQFIDTICG